MNAILEVFEAVLNSLWQAAIVAALIWLALKLTARIKTPFNAATRYVIWWAALAVVLVLPAGPRLMEWWHTRPQLASANIARPASSPASTVSPLVEPPVMVTLRQDRAATWPLWIGALWASVFLVRLSQIGRSYLYLRGVKRRARISTQPLPVIRRPAQLLVSDEIVSPMAVGFLRPAIILPESLSHEITRQQLDHVLLHETAHIARGDDWTNLAARLLGAALALHPVAVWMLRQIDRERETACDDWVVAKTGAARPYAASLARIFELRSARRAGAQGEALASGIFGGGSRLGERIELLLKRGCVVLPRASRMRVAFAALVLTVFVIGGSFAPRWIAFAQARPAFEVASVKPNRDRKTLYSYDPIGIDYANAALAFLISEAYQVPVTRISSPNSRTKDLLLGVYDVTANAGRPVPKEQLMLMLQTLLADRFKLVLHRESKVQAVYKLVVGANGPKFQESVSEGAGRRGGMGFSEDGLVFRRVLMSQFSIILTGHLDRQVLDRTEMNGIYDFTLKLDSQEGPPAFGPKTEASGDWSDSSIFSDIQKQLGLQLVSDRAPVDYLVVDHLEKPSEN